MITVLIWNNHMAHTGHTYPGHAAMDIWDDWPSHYSDNKVNGYVSWVPAGVDQQSQSHNRAGSPNSNLFVDLVFERYAPDHIITIPTTPGKSSAMAKKWREIRTKNYSSVEFTTNVLGVQETHIVQAPNSGASYKFYRKNCSVIVQRVLKAGGMNRAWSGFVHFKSTIWTPLNVKRLALTYAGAKTVTWNEFLTGLEKRGRISMDAFKLLSAFERRTYEHGSSDAIPRHTETGRSKTDQNAAVQAIQKL